MRQLCTPAHSCHIPASPNPGSYGSYGSYRGQTVISVDDALAGLLDAANKVADWYRQGGNPLTDEYALLSRPGRREPKRAYRARWFPTRESARKADPAKLARTAAYYRWHGKGDITDRLGAQLADHWLSPEAEANVASRSRPTASTWVTMVRSLKPAKGTNPVAVILIKKYKVQVDGKTLTGPLMAGPAGMAVGREDWPQVERLEADRHL